MLRRTIPPVFRRRRVAEVVAEVVAETNHLFFTVVYMSIVCLDETMDDEWCIYVQGGNGNRRDELWYISTPAPIQYNYSS